MNDHSTDASESGGTTAKAESFRLGRVLGLVAALLLVGGVATGAYWLITNQEPRLYPVKGVVTLDGEPLTTGAIMTEPTEGGLGGIAVPNENGEFEFRTNGEPGILGGTHHVTVHLTNGGFPPISLIPEKYSRKEQTPFVVEVDSSMSQEPLVLELTGRRTDVPAPPAGGYQRPGIPTGNELPVEDSEPQSENSTESSEAPQPGSGEDDGEDDKN